MAKLEAKIDLGDLIDAGRLIAKGFSNGHTSVQKLGISHALAQRIYRAMQKDEYEGSLPFYVCEKLNYDHLGSANIAFKMLEEVDGIIPDVDDVIKSRHFGYNQKEILFCSLIGSLIRAYREDETIKSAELAFKLFLKYLNSPI